MESKKESLLRRSSYEGNGLRESLQPIAGVNTKTKDDGDSSNSIISEDDDDMPVRSNKRKRQIPITLSSDDNEQQEISQAPVTPTKRSRLFQRYTPAGGSSSESEASTTRLRQKLSISPGSNHSANVDPKIRPRPSEARRKSQLPTHVVISDETKDTSSEEVVITPVRRRKSVVQDQHSSQKPDNKANNESSDDLQSELKDLRDIDTSLRSTRTRDKPIPSKRGKRQQKLEELKRRRADIREAS